MTMELRLDHVVNGVGDLAAASAEWAAAGFTVVPGGAHTAAPTHNALIGFQDGSYLELIARRPGATEPATGLSARLLRLEPDEGLVDFALHTPDLAATVAAARAAGLTLSDPAPSGRARPDGVRLAWASSRPASPDLPFLITDTTPRDLRVPGGPAAQHANGVTGIHHLGVQVHDLDASITRYRALLGMEPQPWREDEADDEAATVNLGVISVPKSHPHATELWALMQQLPSQPGGAARKALLARIRAMIEEGTTAGLGEWVEIAQTIARGQPADRGVDFVLGRTILSLSTPIIDLPPSMTRLPSHGDGPYSLVLRAPGEARPREVRRGGPGFVGNVTLMPPRPLPGEA
jgi:catechol 2,3-dioxygenase-like lactoylglutathione lyase family enzyme